LHRLLILLAVVLDMLDLKSNLAQFQEGAIQDERQFLHDMLAATLQFEKDLQQMTREMPDLPTPPSPPLPSRRPPIPAAIQFGEQKYTNIDAPILAIFAFPRGKIKCHFGQINPDLRG
jgi:hypothetical protein